MRKFFYIYIILLLVSCDNEKIKLSEEEMLRYNTTLQQIEEVEKLYAKAERYKNNGSLAQLMEMSESLAYNYNDKGMNHVTIQHCDSLRDRVAKLKSDCKDFYEHTIISSGQIDLMNIHMPTQVKGRLHGRRGTDEENCNSVGSSSAFDDSSASCSGRYYRNAGLSDLLC